MTAGSGNGTPPRTNAVKTTPAYRALRDGIKAQYPRLREERTLERIEAYMVVCDPEEEARLIGYPTWFMRTPDDFWPVLTIYFTYGGGVIVLQAIHAEH